MKIALLAPAGAMHRYNGSFARALHYSPLTLTTLAALVPPEINADIQIIDETVDDIPLDLDADLIGMTAITGTSQRVYRWADFFRSQGKTVVLGGIHPTLMPQEAAEHADSVVVGSAEKTWPQLLKDHKNSELKKFYRETGEISLAGRPIPRRDLLKKERYVTTNVVEATKGCYHTCSFCVIPATNGQNVYTRPVKEVIREIEQLPGKELIFVDANLIANPFYAKELFKALIPLKRHWGGLVTCHIGKNQELFDLMVKSGCKGLLIGFESVTSAALQSISKSFNKVLDYELLVKKLHDAGIAINGTFVLGTDGDDRSVFKRTVDVIQKLRIDLPRYAIMTPFPGTALYQQLERDKRIIERDWALYDVEHSVIKPLQMSAQELDEGLIWAWNETYKISSITQRIASFSSRLLLDIPVNLGYRMYAQKMSRFTRDVMLDNSDIPFYEKNYIHIPSYREEVRA